MERANNIPTAASHNNDYDRRNDEEGVGENAVSIVNNGYMKDHEGAGHEICASQLQTGDNEYSSADIDTFIQECPETSVTTFLADAESTSSFSFEIEQDSSNNSNNMEKFQSVLDQEEETVVQECVKNDAVERKSKEKFNVECLSYELQVGYRILSNLMSASVRCVSKLFLYPVDDTFPETADYYDKIHKPMWLFKMKEKFEKLEYNDLAEFMSDFRLMIENCYRYNGPDNFVSKKAQKLELMMKQKVALLSRDLRQKIASSSSTNSEDDILTSAGLKRRVRNPNAVSDDPSQQLLSQLRRDRVMQEKVGRRQKVEDRKAMEQARIQEIQTWEDQLLGPEVTEQIRTMWELPQIGLFVYLCMESLGLEEEVTQYQIERGLAIPRECSDFQRLMTCLLSTPHQRKSLKTFMPYNVWNTKLMQKVDYFYKVLSDNNGNQPQTCFVLGLDMRAFQVMGKHNPMLKKQFHQLSYLKRVWILKNFCDFCMETQPVLQKTIEDIEVVRPMDVREVQLGSDGRGNRYINFPMFTGKDIRIYRHSKYPEPTRESLNMEGWSVETGKVSVSPLTCSTPVNQKIKRVMDTSSTSQKAKALLRTTESKEATPTKDTPHLLLETTETKLPVSNSLPQLSNTDDIAKGKQTAPRKRKRTSFFFSKRKRFKPDKKAAVESMDKLGGDKDEEVVAEASVGNDVAEQNITDVSIASASGDNKTKSSTLFVDSPLAICNGTSSSPSVDKEKFSVVSKAHLKQDFSNDLSSMPAAAPALSSDRITSSATQKTSDTHNCSSQDSSIHHCPDFQNDEATSSINSSTSTNINTLKICGSHPHKDVSNSVIKVESNYTHSPSINSHEKSDRPHEESMNEMNNISSSSIKPETKPINNGKLSQVNHDSKTSIISSSVKQEVCTVNEHLSPEHKHNLGISCKQETKNQKTGYKTVVKSELYNKFNSKCDEKDNEMKDWTDTSSCNDGLSVDKKTIVSDLSIKVEDSNEHTMETLENKLSKSSCQDDDIKAMSQGVDEKDKDKVVKTETEDDSDEEDDEDFPDLGQIELVAESMEEIRQLINRLSNPEPTKKGKRVIPGVVKPCEEELVVELSRFLEELSRYERSLGNARLEMQTKLRKDVENYVEPKEEEAKDWESEHSAESSSDSSDDEESAESKADVEVAKQVKKVKPKPPSSVLLSSAVAAASKLNTLTGELNEDSNDSFELDISSRGRLRKRRIIPNNTEDTGLKRRKNLPNQDSFFSSSSTGSVNIPIATTTEQVTMPVVSVQQQQHHLSKQVLPSAVSLLTSNNSAIKAQLAAQTSGASGQIVRLIAPTGDGTLKTVRIAQPGIILSSQDLSNICLVSSTGVVNVSRNTVLTSSSAQVSHPVIQQMLLNQNKPSQHSPLTSSAFTVRSSNGASGLLSKHLSGTVIPTSLVSKASFVTTASSSGIMSLVSKPSVIMVSQPTSVVIPQVSTIVSQGGKQVLDLGSLSVTQLQQLMKNQAVQINTGAGKPTTLFLTTGLQHQASNRISGIPSILGTGAATHIRLPVNQSVLQQKSATVGTTSLLTLVNNSQAPALSQTAPNNKFNPVMTFSRQLPLQAVRSPASTTQFQTHIKINTPDISQTPRALQHGLSNTSIHAALARTTSLVPSLPCTVLVSSAQLTSVSKNTNSSAIINVASLTTSQKPIPSSRVISSLTPTGSGRITVGASNTIIAQRSPEPYSVALTNNNPWTVNSDTLKSRIITVPLVHLSPSKKYANNVTVKALLENRGTKKSSEEESDSSVCDQQQSIPNLTNGVSADSSFPMSKETSNIEFINTCDISMDNDNEEYDKCEPFSNSNIFDFFENSDSYATDSYMSVSSMSGQANTTVKSMTSSQFSSNVINPLTLPLSLDMAMSSITASSGSPSEIILPTMNMKVPSPKTLPSMHHNINGTTIVQSTRVPIPVAMEAKTGDSLSPSGTISSANIHHGTSLQGTSVRVYPTVTNLTVMPANNTLVRTVNSNPAVTGNSSQLTSSGLKNILLKVTPQGGGSGQLVQGYVTSRGLVIPQAALLQQNQQVSNAILGSTAQSGAITHHQPGHVQIQQSSMLGAGKQQTVLNFNACSSVGQQMQQKLPQNVLVAAPNVLSSSNLSQGSNPSLKVVLVKAPSLSTSHPIGSSVTLSNQPQQQTTTTTPASELVKQIINNSQLQTGSHQHKMMIDPKSFSSGNSQQNTVQLMNNIVQGSTLQHSSSVSSLPIQNIVNISSAMNPQLAAQILALQQNSKLQQQSNIVLAAKPLQSQGASQSKQSVITLQVQQLGQLLSNFSGMTQLQMGDAHQIQQSPVSSIQQQLGSRVAQPNQTFQLPSGQLSSGQLPSGSKTINPSQIVRVTGQMSPQLQISNQGGTQIQPNSNIVIQQHPNQNVMFQPALGSNTIRIQPNSNQFQMGTLQQQMLKTPQPSIQRLQTTPVGKVQFSSTSLTQAQQLVNTSQSPNLLMSQLQAPSVSVSSSSFNQPQTQFIINPSATSLSTLALGNSAGIQHSLNNSSGMPHSLNNSAGVSPTLNNSAGVPHSLNNSAGVPHSLNNSAGVPHSLNNSAGVPHSLNNSTGVVHSLNKYQIGCETGNGNICRVIRADSTLINPQAAGILGFTTPNELRHITTGGISSVHASTLATKPGTHLTISNSKAGQVIVSPFKIEPQNSHENKTNPVKYHTHNNCSTAPGNTSNSAAVVNNPLSHTTLSNFHNQVPVKPTLFCSGQPGTVSDNQEGKIAQLLLSQPVSSIKPAQVIVNNHLTSLPKLQSGSSVTKLGTDNSSLTFVYRIGDQYFSPAANMEHMIPQVSLSANTLTTQGIVTSSSKPDVQLLVPPAFIEASDQILKQSIKSQAVPHQMPSSATSLETNSINFNEHHVLSQFKEKDIRHIPHVIEPSRDINYPNMASVNGIHQATTQFSFSQSSPLSVTNKELVKPVVSANGGSDNGAATGADGEQSSGSIHLLSHSRVLRNQNQHAVNVASPSTRNIIDGIVARRNTFSGSLNVASSLKGTPPLPPQRHLSSDDSVLTLQEQDEKEAAMNLLTLANQQI